ncbi:acyltransferase family protein [Streptomyces sp. N2-109]|uniref:Acyltransferase family protein n=1 Tax=Streptomyces gossypii TaxID=2883101 RepID=A0ABT2JSM9_9ACTN|nr:acyltransferase family protein [Streptomyces gossypii]MCT2590893.1 acyltransferase family protein [Streptomyces gossypii]
MPPTPSAESRSPLPPERRQPADESSDGGPDQAANEPSGPPRGRWRRRKAAARTEEAGRDAFFDNAKYLAIVLVACAHAWEPLRADSRAAMALYMFVYTFHMPAFIVISGYFSRGFDLSPRRLRRLVTGVLVPYLVFEVAYAYFRRWSADEPDYPVNVVNPQFLNWFLIALFIWRLTTPLWQAVRWPLPIAVGVGLMSSVTPGIGGNLDLQRVLQFLPFFVLGLVLRPEHFAWVRRRKVRLLALPVAAAALGCAYWAATRLKYQWFFHRESGQELGVDAWVGGSMYLALVGCSLLMSVCFLAWVPGRRMWFTALGAGTLYGYLLHGFLVKGSVEWDWYGPEWVETPAGMVAVTLLAAVVITLLCTAPVRAVFRFVMEPKMEWLFRPDPVAQARHRVRTEGEKTPRGTGAGD